MPLWHIYHPQGTYGDHESKAALAKAITSVYTEVGLPAFYVNVYFHPIAGENIWIRRPAANPSQERRSLLGAAFCSLCGREYRCQHGW